MVTSAALPFPPVIVATDRFGRLRSVGSVREAAEMLTGDWPAQKRSNAWRCAAAAAFEALSGHLAPLIARNAFIAAAKDVDIFVREGR